MQSQIAVMQSQVSVIKEQVVTFASTKFANRYSLRFSQSLMREFNLDKEKYNLNVVISLKDYTAKFTILPYDSKEITKLKRNGKPSTQLVLTNNVLQGTIDIHFENQFKSCNVKIPTFSFKTRVMVKVTKIDLPSRSFTASFFDIVNTRATEIVNHSGLFNIDTK